LIDFLKKANHPQGWDAKPWAPRDRQVAKRDQELLVLLKEKRSRSIDVLWDSLRLLSFMAVSCARGQPQDRAAMNVRLTLPQNYPLSRDQHRGAVKANSACFVENKLLYGPCLSQFTEEQRMQGSAHAHSFSGRGKRGRPQRKAFFRPAVEQLEDRITPYVLSGYSWANTNISASFMPDGTWDTGYQSNLFALYNASYPTAIWQLQFARALQTWANASSLNFHFVTDSGLPSGTTGLAQGDSRFGDIRFGATPGQLALGHAWFPGNSTSGGDVTLNGTTADYIGSSPDLYSLVLHELGIALGLGENSPAPSVLNGPGPYYAGLFPDDIAGIQALYGTRPADTASHSLASPTPLTLSSGGVTQSGNLTFLGDLDYYAVTAPGGTSNTLTASVDARNLSLFDPELLVYDTAGHLLATAKAPTYGSVATVNLTGLVAGKTYIIEAAGATTGVFGMGAYTLSVHFGSSSAGPSTPPANPGSTTSSGPSGTSTPPATQPPPPNLVYVANALAHSTEYYSNLVTGAYQKYLGRAASQTEVAAWVSALQNGLISDELMEAGFIGSSEYIQNHGGPGAGWITGMYQNLLGRTPAQTEVDRWLAALASGESLADVAFGFAASPEREAQRITADYQTYLGRLPSASEVANWVQAFNGYGISNEDIVAGFVGSPEFFQKHKADITDWLVSAYEVILGRLPDPEGEQAWLQVLANG
jgi:hypothetical protein